MKRHRKWVIPAAVLLVLCLVVGRVVAVNATATRFQEMSYPQGEWVPLEGDFFYTSLENTDGYFVRVSSAEAMTYEEFLERFEKPLDYLGEESRHDVIVLKVDFKNQDNTQGGVLIRDLNLVNSARSRVFQPQRQLHGHCQSGLRSLYGGDQDPAGHGGLPFLCVRHGVPGGQSHLSGAASRERVPDHVPQRKPLSRTQNGRDGGSLNGATREKKLDTPVTF